MAVSATSLVCLEAEPRKLAVQPMRAGEMPSGMKEDDMEEDMRRRQRCLLERLMASSGPASRFVYDVTKARTRPYILYTMMVSVNKARVSWSHRSSHRFILERRGSAFRIPLFHAVEHDQVESVAQKSTEPDEPDRVGILSSTFDPAYQLHELYHVRNVVRMERSSVSWVEVVVIRAIPGGCGIIVTSHVDHLVARLHDILLWLPARSSTVDIRFTEHWFCLPAGWMEERLYTKEGVHFVDIAAPVEALMKLVVCDASVGGTVNGEKEMGDGGREGDEAEGREGDARVARK
jgi:hypothetical protein